MKKVLFFLAICATAFNAKADSFTFKPNDGSGNTADMFDLDHYYAYSWGISGTTADSLRNALVSGGQQIVSAKLTIWNIWDWTIENDILNIHLLDDPAKGIVSTYDNQSGGDFFAGKGPFLTSWSDPKGGNTSDKTFDFIYNFSTGNIGSLTSFIVDPTATNKAIFGLGFDPDCHYYNDGIQLDIVTAKRTVPDGATTVSILGLGLISIAAFRRFFHA